MTEQEKQTTRNADAPVQDSVGGMTRRLLNPRHVKELAGRMIHTLRQDGFEQVCRDIRFRIALARHEDLWQHRADIPTRRQLKIQRANPIADGPLVSIVVPLYNTPIRFLHEMLDSVRQQTYPNWQLCLVDASQPGHEQVEQVCRNLSHKDCRICYEKLTENLGIAGNTNAGLAMAKGQWITLLDHDDTLYPNALYEMVTLALQRDAEMVYSDEIVVSDDGKELRGYHFKPDYAPDYLNGCNYITHLCMFRRDLFVRAGGREDPAYDGAQDYDLILRLTEHLSAQDKVAHLPKVLYNWRAGAGSTAENLVEAKPYAVEAGRRAIQDHLERLGRHATVESLPHAPGAYRVKYAVEGTPKISVIIPNKDHVEDLRRCLESLYAHAGYENFEVLVAENNSTEPETFAYYEQAKQQFANLKIVTYQGSFNFSAINNTARKAADGEYLLLLNNDIEVLSDDFLAELLSYAQRPDVGAVGAKLFYPDDTIQHGGVILGINGSAGHSHKSHPRDAVGDLYRLVTAQNYMAVTGACLMVKAELYDACGGLDETDFAVAYNDVDLCLKLYERGYLNVFTPEAQAYHYESKSRGLDDGSAANAANQARYAKEKAAFQAHWGKYLPEGADPYYNIHFNNKFENFGLK